MAIATLKQVKEQLGVTLDIDDALLTRKLAAAQSHIERLLGFEIEEEFDDIPPALVECVCQLAAFWYEHRGSGLLDGGDVFKELPFGIHEIVREYRNWTF